MQTMELINVMPEVQKFREEMNILSDRWNLLTLLGQMSNIGMDMNQTRKAFEKLMEDLLNRLAEETMKKSVAELQSKASAAVDILIRNLFERTADIGFLATDDDIRDYLLFIHNKSNEETLDYLDIKKQKKERLFERFHEYVNKYSVYDNIILLDTMGKVLIQLDNSHPLTHSKASLIHESLTTRAEYVETFASTDLTNYQESLIYSYRVSDTSGENSLGVLCLIFKFDDEMGKIFKKFTTDNRLMALCLLDKNGIILNSSSSVNLPKNHYVSIEDNETMNLDYFAGIEYLYKSASTKGYQGYYGPGWLGHAMIPLHLAFKSPKKIQRHIDVTLLKNVLSCSTIFSKELKDIPKKADKIQLELDVTVWNGNVQIANTKNKENSFSKSLLNEISKTGAQTKVVFENSIANLNNTIINAYLDDAKFQASLAIEIMDRNLYERANDCRWWALTTTFREVLASNNPHEYHRLTPILEYINRLYTVYTNMVIYDKQGYVVATSNPKESYLVGKRLNFEWVNRTLGLKNTQDYTVSGFEKSSLYHDDFTYIYNACIMDFDGNAVGGIGIVFDATPQFEAMLYDNLPKNERGEVANDAFALFVDRQGQIIASTNPRLSRGHSLSLARDFLTKQRGDGHCDIIEFDNKYYVVGSMTSAGYREYKVSDGYDNDIIALIYVFIGDKTLNIESKEESKGYDYPRPGANEETIEISTFFIGGKIFGLESASIECSLTNQEITPIINANAFNLGLISYNKKTINVISLAKFLGIDKKYNREEDTIIIVKTQNHRSDVLLGLVVDAIFDSPEIPLRSIREYGNVFREEISLTKSVVVPDCEGEAIEMLSILDIEKIYDKLVYKPHH